MKDDDTYRQSSQFQLWSFSSFKLRSLREAVNAAAADRVRKNLVEEKNVESATTNGDGDANGEGGIRVECLTPEEEQVLVDFYADRVYKTTAIFKDEAKNPLLAAHIRATAVTFFKRFYLRNSVMDYHPKQILFTCIFFATKSENLWIGGIDTFCRIVSGANKRPVTPAEVLTHEFLLCQSLSFAFTVHHPYRALHGLYLDLQQTLPNIPVGELGKWYDTAKTVINKTICSDAQFLYTPPQIAMTAYLTADTERFTLYLTSKITNDAEREQVSSQLTKCREYLKKWVVPTLAQATAVDKKLHYCKNPDKDPNSALFRKRKADEAQHDEERKMRKVKEAQEKARKEQDDLFGAPL
ncbi:hypothetical protein G7K_0691-t1 [Saitoella complicata NRRL Y-17804]|uniref:Cyclin-like domain-containing protein n=1 Tax=Saitoella complicata (strain BCRC 22490 / CBS 7301 / JCM 7358 / NBRC 10748 / NRRL Y-17804) TaxID=698492 RepID=A0A0E9NAM7_SAICN|nr:hypothetical protein G7K_0691-t1 [Saitoella complicata NRRL Y-17804]